MINDNVCKFVPSAKNAPADINAVNFVLESTDIAQTPAVKSVYALHLVTQGSGVLTLDEKRYGIEKGNLFFTLPSSRYSICGEEGLEYAYVSFLGGGAPALVKRVMQGGAAAIFDAPDGLVSFWKTALGNANPQNVDLLSKSVLEYSAALLINYLPEENSADAAARIERYVQSNFTSADLRLKSLARQFGYNEKYLSKLFFRYTGMHFGSYLANLRINAACALMQEGKTAIKEIAFACGFSDPLYFSKVFKSKMGVTPSQFTLNLK
jgi:AraC-like DNA-binding protein